MDGINPGRLRDRVTITGLALAPDGRGNTVLVGEPEVFSTMAEVTPMKPVTSIENGKLTVIQTYSVLIRLRANAELTADMKVTYRDKSYVIKNIVETDSRRRLQRFMMVRAE